MSDDPAQAIQGDAAGPGLAYVQIVEVTAGPIEAAEAIEQPDEQGRIPVLVRIRRQPPINPIWILIAIGLAASGLFLPLVTALRAIIIVLAVVAVIVGLTSRLFMRIPPGSVGLVAKSGRHSAVLENGIHRVNPLLALTHLVTTRELAFDVPVAAVRSIDGVNVNVDLVLTLGIGDPVKLAYSITTSDLDEFIHATSQEAVRLLIRRMEALNALDLGADEASLLRTAIDAKLAAYGVNVRNVAFTRVLLPEAITASLEARRLATIQLSEEQENFALEERRLNDRANLVALDQESRRKALELESLAEALRFEKMEERLTAYPTAARYDVEMQRLKVAQQLAGNSRAVVSLGGSDLVAGLLTAQQAGGQAAAEASAATTVPAASDPTGSAAPADGAPNGDGRRPRGAVPRRTSS